MLTIIRSNRTNFQHIHPIYNEKTGIFTIADFQLPTSGIYRLFAQFTAANTPKNHDGFNSPSTVFTDISVSGDDTVQPRQEASDALTSSADGFSTSIFSASNNIDTPESPPGFTAGRLNILAINITKNGIPFKNLKGYKGSFGRIFAFSPSCELISANSEAEVGDHQTGTLKFKLTFPTAGRYVLFMQTQANNQVTTFSYTIIVKKELTS